MGSIVPELPEVETVVRDLRQALVGQIVREVEIYWDGSVATPCPDEFRAGLRGQRVLDVQRRGKFIVVGLQRGHLLVHLRMTGQLLLTGAHETCQGRHLRIALTLDGKRLLFSDQRKFGRMYLVQDPAAVLAGLGPEPLEGGFTAERLARAAARRRVAIKSLLLDQRVLAGVGNIYADEALHAAGIAPQRQACTLDPAEVTRLHAAIRAELERAIGNRGTTLSDYRDANGQAGQHSAHLRVHGRAGEPCERCGCAVQRVRIGGRSSYYCPRCQR